MHDIDDETVKGVIGEEIKSQLDAVLEYVKDVPALRSELREVKEKVDDIDTRLTTVEAVVTDMSSEMKEMHQQINRVETDGKMTRALVEDVVDTVKRHDRDIRVLKRKIA